MMRSYVQWISLKCWVPDSLLTASDRLVPARFDKLVLYGADWGPFDSTLSDSDESKHKVEDDFNAYHVKLVVRIQLGRRHKHTHLDPQRAHLVRRPHQIHSRLPLLLSSNPFASKPPTFGSSFGTSSPAPFGSTFGSSSLSNPFGSTTTTPSSFGSTSNTAFGSASSSPSLFGGSTNTFGSSPSLFGSTSGTTSTFNSGLNFGNN